MISVLMFFFRIMGPRNASNIAGSIGGFIGPKLATSRRATGHLNRALPAANPETTIPAMWNNLVRIVAEYPHLETIAKSVEIQGFDHLEDAYKKHNQAIIFSGHIGNWEVMAPTLLTLGIQTDLVYRAPNNPWVDRMLDRYRSLNGKLKTMAKSRTGTRALVEAVKSGRSVGILIDQKYNEGIEADFFGIPAMTSTAFVQLAQKFNVPLIPFRVERIDGVKLRLSFYPALPVEDKNGHTLPPEAVVQSAHALLESWITERPDQWLWLHKRWKTK